MDRRGPVAQPIHRIQRRSRISLRQCLRGRAATSRCVWGEAALQPRAPTRDPAPPIFAPRETQTGLASPQRSRTARSLRAQETWALDANLVGVLVLPSSAAARLGALQPRPTRPTREPSRTANPNPVRWRLAARRHSLRERRANAAWTRADRLGPRGRHACACSEKASGPAEQPRCALRPLPHRQIAAGEARCAVRRPSSGGDLPRADWWSATLALVR